MKLSLRNSNIPGEAETKRVVEGSRACARRRGSELGGQHGVGCRLLRAPVGFDSYRYDVVLVQGLLDNGGDRLPVGFEEAARLRDVALYNPDLVGLVLRHPGHVLGHQDRLVTLEEDQLCLGPLRGPGSRESHHPALLRVLQACYLTLQLLDLTLQQHVPGEEPDHEQGGRAQREVLDAQELSYRGEPGPGPCGRTLRLG